MRYSIYPAALFATKRKFKLYWNDSGQEIIEGRGENQIAALENAYRRVGYSSETLKSLTFWEEI